MFCCAVLCVLFSFAIILMGKRELVALLCLSSWCLVTVSGLRLFLTLLWVGLQCMIVVFLIIHTIFLHQGPYVISTVYSQYLEFQGTE